MCNFTLKFALGTATLQGSLPDAVYEWLLYTVITNLHHRSILLSFHYIHSIRSFYDKGGH